MESLCKPLEAVSLTENYKVLLQSSLQMIEKEIATFQVFVYAIIFISMEFRHENGNNVTNLLARCLNAFNFNHVVNRIYIRIPILKRTSENNTHTAKMPDTTRINPANTNTFSSQKRKSE